MPVGGGVFCLNCGARVEKKGRLGHACWATCVLSWRIKSSEFFCVTFFFSSLSSSLSYSHLQKILKKSQLLRMLLGSETTFQLF